MMSGYERYYQIARCFRDEDLRADRQPEFTQLDLEMGFVEEEDVLGAIEGLLRARLRGRRLPGAAAAVAAAAATTRRCCATAPTSRTLRFALEIADLGEAVANTEFRVFKGVLEGGGVVRGFNAGPREASRAVADQLTEVVKRYGAGGLVWAVVQEDGTWRSPAAKALSDDDRRAIERRAAGQAGRPAADRRRREPERRRHRRWASCGSRSRAATT